MIIKKDRDLLTIIWVITSKVKSKIISKKDKMNGEAIDYAERIEAVVIEF